MVAVAQDNLAGQITSLKSKAEGLELHSTDPFRNRLKSLHLLA